LRGWHAVYIVGAVVNSWLL